MEVKKDHNQEVGAELDSPEVVGSVSRRAFLGKLGAAGTVLAAGAILQGATSSVYGSTSSTTVTQSVYGGGGSTTCATLIKVTIADLRTYASPSVNELYEVTNSGQEGFFYYDSLDTTTVDNTGTVLVSTAGARFKRIYEGTLNARWFGVSNNGTDCYNALKQMAITISGMISATVLFPPGTYRIDKYKITGGPGANGITDITYSNCKGLSLIGYGAVFDIKGDFHRPRDYEANGFKYSYSCSVVPFRFSACDQLSVEGFELDGNVDLMTRDTGVVEAKCPGILTSSCTNYTFRNLDIHHFMSDGLYLGGSNTKCDRNALLMNVKSTYNARQGISVIQLDKGQFIDCTFSETGKSAGSYGSHAPGAGCDVEPNFDTPTIDVRTNGLSFLNCTFENNTGSQFVSAVGGKVENIYLNNVKLVSSSSGSSVYALILAINNAVIENSYMDLKNGVVYPTFGVPNTRTTIRNCKIISYSQGLSTTSSGDGGILIENCEFIGSHTSAFSSYFPYILNSNVIFRGNSVFIPKEAYGAASLTFQVVTQMKVALAENNSFRTDLVPTANEHFAVNYIGSGRVSNDLYISGTAFRPSYNSTFPTAYPYSTGTANLGIPAYPTSGRPAGYKNMMIIDTTLNSIIWFDGGSWRNAMGTIV